MQRHRRIHRVACLVLLVALALGSGCGIIQRLFNTAAALLPMLLLVTVEEADRPEPLLAVTLQSGNTLEPVRVMGPPGSPWLEISDVAIQDASASATLALWSMVSGRETLLWREQMGLVDGATWSASVTEGVSIKGQLVRGPSTASRTHPPGAVAHGAGG